VIGFAFDCGEADMNAGMSIPLLSVCLATLMALFRDPESASQVKETSLTFLIREAGAALLDKKLSSSSPLKESTASQMVRAINKVSL
jgi:predicted secreted Zn-dependent protease